MSMTSEEITNLQMNGNNLIGLEEIDLYRFFIVSYIMILYSLFSYGIFYYLSKCTKLYSGISKIMDFSKSIFAGLIFSKLSKLTDYKMFFIDPEFGFSYHLVSNLPFILMTITFLAAIPWTFCLNQYYSKKYNLKELKSAYKQQNADVFLDFMVPVDKKSNISDLTKRDKETKTTFKSLETKKKYFLKRIDIFNTKCFSLIYLLMVCFHSLFSGLGFSGYKHIGWFEIFIFGHRIIEVFRFKRSLDDVNWNKYWSFIFVVFFCFFTTPIAILSKGLVVSYDGLLSSQNSKELNNLFIQSFMAIIIIETLFPIPKTILDCAINYLVTLVSVFCFKLFLK